MLAPGHAAFGATGESFRRSPAGAGLLQEARLRLRIHSHDSLLELADEAGLAVMVRAHLVHELVPAAREPGYPEAPLRSAELFNAEGLLLALPGVNSVQTEGATTEQLIPDTTHRRLPPSQTVR